MRTALVSGFLFYATGLIALGFDVAARGISTAPQCHGDGTTSRRCSKSPSACRFIARSFSPLRFFPVSGTVYYTGNERSRALLCRVAPIIRKAYPFVIIGAYVIPLMHQSSLAVCFCSPGPKSTLSGNRPSCPALSDRPYSVAGLHDLSPHDRLSSLCTRSRRLCSYGTG